jgi:hypothetical protein
MAIATTGSQVNVLGTNVAGQAVPFPYRFFVNSDLTVQTLSLLNGAVATLVLTTDYTVTGADNVAGGTVTLIAAVPTTSEIVIVRNLPETQTVSFSTGDRLPASTLERSLDKLTMLVQEVTRQVVKALRFSDVTVSQPPLTPLANSVLSTDASNQISFVPTSAATGDTPYFLRAATAGATPSFAPIPLITASRIAANAVITSKLLAANVTPDKIGGNPTVGQWVLGSTNGTVLWQLPSTTGIEDDAVTTTKIADNAVTAPKLQSDPTVDANRAVTTEHIRDNAVGAAQLQSNATTDANRAVTTDHIRDNAATSAKVSSSDSSDTLRAITSNHIRNAAITDSKLSTSPTVDATRCVTTNAIRNSAVTSEKLADSSVDFSKVASGMVVGRAYVQSTALATLTGNTPQLVNPANTALPLVTQGIQILSLSYTPKALGNILVLRFYTPASTGAVLLSVGTMLFENSTCKGFNSITHSANTWRTLEVSTNIVVATDLTARTFTSRVGLLAATAGTTVLLSTNTALWGGAAQMILEVTEYKA